MQGNFLFSEFCFDDVDGLHSGSFQLVNVFYFPFSVFSGFKAVANYHGEDVYKRQASYTVSIGCTSGTPLYAAESK